MEQKIVWVFHYHLPQCESSETFEKIYNSKLKPFFQILYEHPDIPFAVHLSGTALYVIERRYPEFFMLIREMVKRRQVELIGGGFFEPMFPLLPEPDRIGQLEFFTTYIRKQFGKKISGCMIPGAAWEQSLINTIAAADLRYTFVDENRFKESGYSGDYYSFPCISEEKGRTLTIFPTFSGISEEIRERGVAPALELLLNREGRKPFTRTVIPHFFSENSQPVHTFFEEISRYKDRVEYALPGAECRKETELKKVCFSGKAAKRYLIDFPEAARIYAKMLRTRRLIDQLKGDKERRGNAQSVYFASQDYTLFCYDDEYDCHFDNPGRARYPGIYNTALSGHAYAALIEAERLVRDKLEWMPSLVVQDYDFDNAHEYLFQSHLLSAYVHERGASLFEFDYLPTAWNYQNTVGYGSFFDALLPKDFSADSEELFSRETGKRILGEERWNAVSIDRMNNFTAFVSQKRTEDAQPGIRKTAFSEIEVRKEYKLSENILSTRYVFTNMSNKEISTLFVTRIDLAFSGNNEHILRLYKHQDRQKTQVPGAELDAQDINSLEFHDIAKELAIYIDAGVKFNCSVRSVKKTRRDYTGNIFEGYSWTRVCPRIPVRLAPDEIFEITFKISVLNTVMPRLSR